MPGKTWWASPSRNEQQFSGRRAVTWEAEMVGMHFFVFANPRLFLVQKIGVRHQSCRIWKTKYLLASDWEQWIFPPQKKNDIIRTDYIRHKKRSIEIRFIPDNQLRIRHVKKMQRILIRFPIFFYFVSPFLKSLILTENLYKSDKRLFVYKKNIYRMCRYIASIQGTTTNYSTIHKAGS